MNGREAGGGETRLKTIEGEEALTFENSDRAIIIRVCCF